VSRTRVPQRRRLLRAAGLAAFRETLLDLAIDPHDPLSARRRLLILPTQASIDVFRRTLESAWFDRGARAIILPDLVTRDEWITRLHAALPGAPVLLSRMEREMLLERAASAAAGRRWIRRAPFEIRPGLVAEMLKLYDELRRRQRTIGRFSRTLFEQLKVERGTDRGSESLIQLTAFLGFTFLGYERRVREAGAWDEHLLRDRLLAGEPVVPFEHVVVAVADHPSDPRGLWPADFDLIGRLPGLRRLDVVVTDEIHDAGFRDRVDRELPGIEEVRQPASRIAVPPVIERPEGVDSEQLCFVHRDREEELRDVARMIRGRAAETDGQLREPTAVVFHRPLPYLYLAPHVFADARVPAQTFEALPLAAEPYAALLDLVLTIARTGGTREAAAALLRTPWLRFEVAGHAVDPADASHMDVVLSERRATGEADTYVHEVAAYFDAVGGRTHLDRSRALRAASAAADIRTALLPYRSGSAASMQIGTLARFLRHYERGPADAWPERWQRARGAVLSVLDELAAAHRRHDDAPRAHESVTAAIHHWIEARTFTPGPSTGGVHFLDAVAARFGQYDHVHLVGLIETDWPDRPRRSVFYTSGLLKSLGWPQEADQTRAQQAAFKDLLALPARTLRLHAFQLEGDAVVAPSPMLDAAREMRSVPLAPRRRAAIFADELLTAGLPPLGGLPADVAAWVRIRARRPALTEPAYSGQVDPQPPHPYRVSRVDHYVDCPFKYFAEEVLQLPDEREELSGLTPLERGNLVHRLFEEFYRAWQDERRGAITRESLPQAIEMFATFVDRALANVPDADRALERTRLLGSIVARGVAERVFELEANASDVVVDRLLEFKLRGTFDFPLLHGFGSRSVDIHGQADRIDVLGDGRLRVIDYKLSRLPDLDSSVQIAVYAYAARQLLEAKDGRPRPIAGAMYIAFGDERHLEGALGGRDQPAELAVQARASEFAATIDRIEAGVFPAQPKRLGDCQWCRYAGVCRKEYGEIRAAEPV